MDKYPETFSWKDVLNSRATNAPWWGHILKFWEEAKRLGYPYFEWNERIYDTVTGEDTNRTVSKNMK